MASRSVENPTPDGPRVLTVGVKGDDFQLVLWPGTPGRAEPAMGRPPASITIETDDCRETVNELKSRGVEFVSDVLERLIIGLLSVVALAFAGPAAANPPVEEPILDVFTDINPCTGEETTVTFVGSVLVHEHGNRVIAIAHRTITTSNGFEGHGVDSFVDNGRVLRATLTDILTNEATGQRFRAHSQLVLDLATDTVRVERGGLTCLGP